MVRRCLVSVLRGGVMRQAGSHGRRPGAVVTAGKEYGMTAWRGHRLSPGTPPIRPGQFNNWLLLKEEYMSFPRYSPAANRYPPCRP